MHKYLLLWLCLASLSTPVRLFAQEGAMSADSIVYVKMDFLPGDSLEMYSDREGSPAAGQIHEKSDLNADGYTDLIVAFPASGDTFYGIYVQEADGWYQEVFSPAPWTGLTGRILDKESTIVQGQTWKKIGLYARDTLQAYIAYTRDAYRIYSREEDAREILQTYSMDKKQYQIRNLPQVNPTYALPLLRVMEQDTVRDYMLPFQHYMEISKVWYTLDHQVPYFIVQGRYQLFLIDLSREKISQPIIPGLDINYGEDGISGTLSGCQFTSDGSYILGNAVSYGLFCFNIRDLDHPRELLRFSSRSNDRGQAYFFLDSLGGDRYTGMISSSDTTKKNTHISNFYTASHPARFLFRDARLEPLTAPHIDPADYEKSPENLPYVLLHAQDQKGNTLPWVVDLRAEELLTGSNAKAFVQTLHVSEIP